MLSVLLLGTPLLSLNQGTVTKLRRKNRALLYYIAAHPQALIRDHILNFFWPDHNRASAQQILRTMLYDLRQTLGSALDIEDDQFTLASDSYVDVHQFESALSSAGNEVESLLQAVNLYRGDFLKDFSVPDCPPFEDWVAAERERYRSLALQGFIALSECYETVRNYHAALKTVTCGLALDPLQEELQRSAIRLHYLMGDRASAIRRYDALRRLLDEEMGIPPMAATRALYDAILNDTLPNAKLATLDPASPTPRTQSSQRQGLASALLPFTGRTAELNTLEALAFSGTLILFEGEPGIGKTRLAEEFIAAQGGSNAPLVLRSAAHELEQRLPYQPVIDALRHLLSFPEWPVLRAALDVASGWLDEIGRVIPELAAPGTLLSLPVLDESRLWEGITQFLVSLSRQRPIIVFIDDLQWADPSTVTFLGYLVRRASTASLMIVTTSHPAVSRSALAVLLETLVHEGRLSRLPLMSLSSADTATLAQHFSPAGSDILSDWLMQNAEGNPYFLTELIRYAYDNKLLLADGTLDTQALSNNPIVPQSVQNLVHSRFARLSENAQRILGIAAVIGQEFDVELVIRSAEIPETTVLDALDELGVALLIVPYDSLRYTFDHSLTKEVAYREMGEARYRLLHRRVAETLEIIHHNKLDSVAVLLASHFAKGNAPERAAPYAFQAGQLAAKVVAWAEAIALYEQALSANIEDSLRVSVLLALGEAHFNNGQFPQASESFQTAARVAASIGDNALMECAHLALNQSFYPQARYTEAIALAQELRMSGPSELAPSAEFMWGTALSLEGRYPTLAGEHLAEAERLLYAESGHNSLLSIGKIKYQQAGVFGQQGDFKQAVTLYREALALVEQDESALDLQRHILVYNNLAYYLHLLGDSTAAEYARAGLTLAQHNGSLSHQPYLYSTLGEIALTRDEFDIAEHYFSEGLTLAERLSLPERIAGLTANLGRAAQQRGQIDLAVKRLTDALALADTVGAEHLAARIRTWLAPLMPSDQAHRLLQEVREVAEGGGHRSLLDEIAALEARLSLP